MKWATLEAARSSSWGRGWDSPGRASLRECQAAQSCQARAEEAKEPSWGTAKGGTLTMLSGLGLCLDLGLHRLPRRHLGLEQRLRLGLRRLGDRTLLGVGVGLDLGQRLPREGRWLAGEGSG